MLVAVADPSNVVFSDELRLALGVPVTVGVSHQGRDRDRDRPPARGSDGRVLRRVAGGRGDATTDRRGHRRRPRDARRAVRQPLHREGPRPPCLRHPLRAAGPPRRRPRTHRRRHARDRLDRRLPHVRRRQPPEDHGRPRHRRAPRAAGRPRRREARRGVDRRPRRRAPDDERREGDAAPAQPVERSRVARRPRAVAAQPRRARARHHAAVRRGRRRRPDRARARRRRSTPACRSSTSPRSRSSRSRTPSSTG